MGFLQLPVYIGIFIWMLSPERMSVLASTKAGRVIALKGAAVVTAGYLLSMTCQMMVMIALDAMRIPQIVTFFLYSAVFVAFWLLEAELFHRSVYQFSVKKALLKRKSLLYWLGVTAAATAAFYIYNRIGGLAVTYALSEIEPGIAKFFLRVCSILFQLRLPDLFLAACNFVLYYKTMGMIIRTAEWG